MFEDSEEAKFGQNLSRLELVIEHFGHLFNHDHFAFRGLGVGVLPGGDHSTVGVVADFIIINILMPRTSYFFGSLKSCLIISI